ncbi:MAG TPA: Gfo/Idh/MocA family oxidoreductase [Sedimentisphaerales bacterium]|nr:Gfo/Idh/MocA family oxidoreductase [Sedimentisphaerales bacterium]
MKNTSRITRRSFLKGTAAIGGAAIGLPAIVPASVFGANAPSSRIVMGAIGVGSQGTGDMQGFLGKPEVQMVAICDIDKGHRDNAKKIVDDRYGNKDCTAYHDFRELIGRGDLDAVQLAVPDHWHAIPAIAAARAGLDIHGQKPIARSIREGRAMCDAVHRYGRVWQTGSQQRSDYNFRRACELVRNGRIGKILKVEVGLPTGGGTDVKPVMPVPEGLDWNLWLGPAPYVPYRGVSHWDWRWIMDYSGGQLTDWAGHHIDIAHWGMGWDYTGPVEIEGKGNYPTEGLYNVATQYKFACTYADGTVMTVANNQQITQGAKWYGQTGWIHVNRGGLTASDEKILREEIGPNEIRLYESRDHKQNFLDCVKSRELTICPVEVGHRSISVGLLGEIAMLTGRKIKWDPENEKIVGDPEASALLGRSYREPWIL